MTIKAKSRNQKTARKTINATRPTATRKTSSLIVSNTPAPKLAQLIALLRRPEGASIAEATAELGWQAHSVRGVISGVIKKKLGLTVTVTKSEDATRRYHLA